MKVMTRLNLLSLGIILAMTVAVLAVGTVIINDLVYRNEERVLRLELANAGQAIMQKLNRSGARAAVQTAAELQSRLQEKADLHTGRLYIIESPDNRVVYHPEIPAGDKLSADFIEQMFSRQDGAIEYTLDGVAYYAVFRTVYPLNWLFVLSISKKEMLERTYDFLRAIGGITFLILCLNALLISLFGQRLVRRIGTALDCVSRIERGDLAARIASIPANDELGRLQAGINAMGAGIERRTGEQRAAETALRDSRELLQSIIDNSTAVIYLKDLEGRYLLVNRRYAELFHVSQQAIIGQTDYDVFPHERAEAFRAFDQRVLAAGTAMQAEELAPQDDGLHTYISLKYPLRDASGRPYAVCGISTDITERFEAEAERQARYTAEAANRAKSDFLAAMSHELRTPLNAILGYAQLLKRDSTLSTRQAAGVETIEQSGQHLLMLINDLLDLAKIEAGKLELYPAPLNLASFLTVVADIVRVKAEEKSLLFACETPPHLPHAVQADEKRLRQILLNLLSNAIKFTDRGQVSLKVELLAHEGSRIRLRFAVSDTGVGMTDTQLQRLFQPFEQVGDMQRRAGGTGLGLAISRQLVRLMDGEIAVESQSGNGSRFWFELGLPVLEAALAERPAEPAVSGYAGPRRKVLIVDDVAGNRALLADLLGGLGFDLCEACNGQEAIARVHAEAPDLLLTDLVMPVMDGHEAIRRIRALPGDERLPIIAVSASADAPEQAAAKTAGADAFLAKPIEQDSLLAHIGELLHINWIRAEAPAARPARASMSESVLDIPPREEMTVLYELALAGNMRAIREQATRLSTLDPDYAPFAEALQRLAAGYQSKAILNLVEAHMPKESTS